MPTPSWLTLLLIVLILIGVAVGRVPGLHMNRASIALVGATLLLLSGALTLTQAFAALDLNTLTLLFAMMIVNVNLRRSGFFGLVSQRVLRWAHTPRQLLALLIGATGLLAALFLNDTIVLMLTPLVVEMTLALRRNPLPYLAALATAANIGSVATITGNPQNMIIGIASGISYVAFGRVLTPVAILGLAATWVVIVLVYRDEFSRTALPTQDASGQNAPPVQPALLRQSLLATAGMLIGFGLGAPIPLCALAAAALLLVLQRGDPEQLFAEVDWALLVFFGGLFMVTGAVEHSGWSAQLFGILEPIAQRGVLSLSAVSVLLSNLISNVPAVLLFRPLIPDFAQPQQAWLTLAMATTLAGNLTLLGSVANLIVAELARGHRVELSFGEYLKTGPLITLLSLSWGIVWLWWVS
ncbi:MAG: anion transporter [Caldilineaceae bacterium]|nr:anion transporter [Caldilineaceae bacterium]